jgi:hypothetical protein
MFPHAASSWVTDDLCSHEFPATPAAEALIRRYCCAALVAEHDSSRMLPLPDCDTHCSARPFQSQRAHRHTQSKPAQNEKATRQHWAAFSFKGE